MSSIISLAQLRIASPCPASWDDMEGDDRVRFCSDCKLNVYDVSEMSEAEALAMVRETEGRLCMRLHRRSDGTVITRDCPIGLRAATRRQLARLVGGIAAVVMLAGSALGIIHGTPIPRDESCGIPGGAGGTILAGEVRMGKMAAPAPSNEMGECFPVPEPG